MIDLTFGIRSEEGSGTLRCTSITRLEPAEILANLGSYLDWNAVQAYVSWKFYDVRYTLTGQCVGADGGTIQVCLDGFNEAIYLSNVELDI